MWMNVACLIGRATSEPKRKSTNGGTEYVTIRIAVPRSKDQTDFFTVECWGGIAQVALKHVDKGKLLSLRCELRHQEWGSGADRKERIVLVVRKLGLLSRAGNHVDDATADTEAA